MAAAAAARKLGSGRVGQSASSHGSLDGGVSSQPSHKPKPCFFSRSSQYVQLLGHMAQVGSSSLSSVVVVAMVASRRPFSSHSRRFTVI